ncbi:MAG: hypothetical protein J5928_05330 [Firmicutes bacterium]|nr:hypothetical protein [Bacillota bacterium]
MKQVYYNGKVYTNTGGNPAQAFIVENGKFLAIGTDEDMVTMALGPAMALFDLKNGFVCPNFEGSAESYLDFNSDRDFDESVRGRIARGESADFVVLGKSPFEVPDSDIKKIPILSVYKGGKEK